ncbi:hypothetical protein K2Q08_02095 [Patescibacteria group bacterium]|nr:hypothetical protein [Patescibacteria group bacterium]
MNKIFLYIISGLVVLLIAAGGAFFLFQPSTPTQTSTGGFFGFGSTAINVQNTTEGEVNTPQVGVSTLQSVFKIADGPVAGAVFTQTFNPTTTLARYTKADNGHVLELPIGVSGAVARAVSNVTIPGITTSLWTTGGTSTVMQYVDSGVLKSVYVAFEPTSSTTASTTNPSRIRFLPNGIVSLAVSPGDNKVAYLLKNSNGGVDGYVSNLDGTGIKNLFSIPLSQVVLSWPSQTTLLVQTKGSFGVPGITYSINATTGVLSPLLYAPGLTATANKNFSKIVYQTSSNNAAVTYSHDITTGKDAPLVNNPLPEKCTWSTAQVTNLYCAFPSSVAAPNYLDLWHQGLMRAADSIVNIDTNTGVGTVVTLPGDGGANSTIEQLILSPDGKYLMFITRGDQSLWGVRL